MNLVQTENVEFTVYNLLGEPVFSETTNEPAGILSKQISVSSLSNGNYILQARTSNNVYSEKLLRCSSFSNPLNITTNEKHFTIC